MIRPLCLVLNLVITTHCKMEGFIVGGELANIDDFPHSAFIQVSCHPGVAFMCGSSILNQKIVLTAAHCLEVCENALVPKVTVSVGSSISNKHKTNAQDFIIHEHFNEDDECENDIALVKLKRMVQLSPKISRVAIMRSPPYSKYGTVTGWGFINEETFEQSNLMRKLQQQIWNEKDCINIIGEVLPNTFCAANKDQSRFLSKGDSGSALVIKQYIQIGIVSYKVPNLANYLSIYTNVSQFYYWIHENAKKLHCKN